MKRALKYFRTQISSGTDPMTIINEILQTIAVKNSKIGEMENKIEKLFYILGEEKDYFHMG